MIVIARIPRLEPPAGPDVVAACGAEVVAVRAWKPEPAGEPAVAATSSAVASTVNGTGRRRHRDGTPFPLASTVVLAFVAIACWMAVWRQERRLEDATDAAGAADDAMAARPESAGDGGGSVTR
jgi:hypothetical protein